MDNIYKLFGDKVKLIEEQGLVPVLFLAAASSNQYKQVKGIAIANGVNPKDLLFVPVKEELDAKSKIIVRTSYVLYAEDEQQALEVFRRRAAFAKVLCRKTATGSIPELLGIDAKGNIRPDTYIPAFNLNGVNREDFDNIVTFAEQQVERIGRGAIAASFVGTNSAQVNFRLRDKLAGTKDIQYIRKRLLNGVCTGIEKNFLCEVERLDDRGGTNKGNICEYLTELNKQEFLAQSVLSGRNVQKSEVIIDEQQTQN